MSEKEIIALPRAMKAAIEFNVSKDTLVLVGANLLGIILIIRHEHVNGWRWGGVALIVVGAMLVGYSERVKKSRAVSPMVPGRSGAEPSLREQTAISAPCSASATAIPLPIPLEAPVNSATFPSKIFAKVKPLHP